MVDITSTRVPADSSTYADLRGPIALARAPPLPDFSMGGKQTHKFLR